jgi:hypothetical protein
MALKTVADLMVLMTMAGLTVMIASVFVVFRQRCRTTLKKPHSNAKQPWVDVVNYMLY